MTIQEVLQSLRVDYLESGHHHCRDGWIQIAKCPFCSGSNYHLGYNVQNRFFTCWRCRWHHVIPTLIALGASYLQAKEFFAGSAPVRRQAEWDEVAKPKNLIVPKHIGPMLKQHRRYLIDRNFDPSEIASIWNVGGIGILGNLKWRLYLPITKDGVQVSWTTRSIVADAKLRYVSASEGQEAVNHKHVIYGADYCHQVIVVVEGPTDAWAVGPGAGALFGTAFTAQQLAKIASYARRFVCFDAASAAQRTARELCARLSVLPGTTENLVLNAKDPGSASRKELSKLRRYCGIDSVNID